MSLSPALWFRLQRKVDPTLFIGHCSAGIIAILVWVDDILVAHSKRELYDAFVLLYSKHFPSKHHIGYTKFAGITVTGPASTQRPHIEHASEKFEKATALKPLKLRS